MVANRVLHHAVTIRNWLPPVAPGTRAVELPTGQLVQEEIQKVRDTVQGWFSRMPQSPWMRVALDFLENQFSFFRDRYSYDFPTDSAAEYFNDFWSDAIQLALNEMEFTERYDSLFYSDFRLELEVESTRETLASIACEGIGSSGAFDLGWAIDSVTHPIFPHYARETATLNVRVENSRSRRHHWHTGRNLPPNLTARIQDPGRIEFLRRAIDPEGVGTNCDLYNCIFQTSLPDVKHFGEFVISAWTKFANQDLSVSAANRIEIREENNRLAFVVDGKEVISKPSTHRLSQIINVLVEHSRTDPQSYLESQRIHELVNENLGIGRPNHRSRFNPAGYLASSRIFPYYFSFDSRQGQSTAGSGYRIVVNDVAAKLAMPSN